MALISDAVKNGDLKRIKQVVSEPITSRDPKNRIPLFVAVEEDNFDVLKYFVEVGADLNCTSNYPHTLLDLAVQKGNEEIVNFLIDNGARVNGISLLSEALKNGYVNIARTLFKKGAKVNGLGKDQLKVLFQNGELLKNEVVLEPFIKIRNYELTSYLIELGAEVELPNSLGETPLITAAQANDFNIVQLLTEKGARINDEDKAGNTPLIYAIRNRNLKIVKFLVERGVNVCKIGRNDNMPLLEATKQEDEAMVNYLLENGARYSMYSSLMSAIEKKNTAIVQVLLKCQDGIRLTNPNGSTPLLKAIENHDVEMATLLIKNGADVNLVTHTTPLLKSIEKRNLEIVQLLIANGADLNLRTNSSYPIIKCVEQENSTILKSLLANGADFNLYPNMEKDLLSIVIQNEDVLSLIQLVNAGTNCEEFTEKLKELAARYDGFPKYIFGEKRARLSNEQE